MLVPALLLLEVFLGAVVVWLELPGLAVLVHLTIALAILSVLVWLALPPRASIPPGTMRADGRDRLRPLVLLTGSALCLLLVAGAFVRATAAGWACLGFPDCNGQGLFSLGQSALADLQLAHRGLAYVTSALVLWLLVASWRQGRKRPAVRSASLALALTMLTRATIGTLRVSTGLPPWLQVLHVAGAAAAWSAMVVLARGCPRKVANSTTAALRVQPRPPREDIVVILAGYRTGRGERADADRTWGTADGMPPHPRATYCPTRTTAPGRRAYAPALASALVARRERGNCQPQDGA